MTAFGVAALGALGAVLRHLVGHWSARGGGWPRGTAAVNVTGSLLAGLLVGSRIGNPWDVVLIAGFCGGYTTFSTWSVEVVELAEEPARAVALAYGGGTALACVLAAWLGIVLVS
ncbi:MAG: fluoride exporter [Frankiales bacterium]|nr:fluoride exporter [Frankiales bacterium]